MDTQADLIFAGAQPFCWFCHLWLIFCFAHNIRECASVQFRPLSWLLTQELQHDKTYKITCAPSKASASTQTDQSLLCAQWEAKDPMFLHADSETVRGFAPTRYPLSIQLFRPKKKKKRLKKVHKAEKSKDYAQTTRTSSFHAKKI